MIGYIRSGDSIDYSEWPCGKCGEKRCDHEWRAGEPFNALEPYEVEGWYCADGEAYEDAD